MVYTVHPCFGKPHGHSISHFALLLVPAVFTAKNIYIYGVVLPKLFQFLSVLMAAPCGAKQSEAKKNVDKENEDTNRSLSAWKSLSRKILQLKCNKHSLVATGSNKLLAKRLFDFFKSKRNKTELRNTDVPRCKSECSDANPSSVISQTTNITPANPGTAQQSSKPPSIEELAEEVRNLTNIVMVLTDKQKRSKKRKQSFCLDHVQ